jgi:hypothetical protein
MPLHAHRSTDARQTPTEKRGLAALPLFASPRHEFAKQSNQNNFGLH